MRCSRAQRLLSLGRDEQLRSSLHAALEEHLEECSECRSFATDIDLIVKEAQQTAPDPSPEPADHLWTLIERRFEEFSTTREEEIHRKPAWFPLFPSHWRDVLAVSGVLAVVVLVLPLLLLMKQQLQRDVSVFPPRTAVHQIRLHHGLLSPQDGFERMYDAAVSVLKSAMDMGPAISPEIAVVLQENISIIDQSISACQDILAQHPDDLDTREFLMQCYQAKIDLLSRMQGMELMT